MSKDPAFLFYPESFITGTIFLSNEAVGIYIKLLCFQHQHGGMIKKSDFNSMVNGFELLREKFIETDCGFYNERLMDEMDKRNRKCNNLSANAKKRWDKEKKQKEKKCKSNANAYANVMQTKDRNRNRNKDLNLDVIKEIIEDLNSKLGSSYRETNRKVIDLINLRISEGATKEDFFKVHDNMIKNWGNTEQAPYLRHQTLYTGNFDSYLNYIPKTIKRESEWL